MDTRLSSQGVNLQPRIVGNNDLPRVIRYRPCLLQGIFRKGCPVFYNLRDTRIIIE
jgi:hypothetical protein